MNHEPTHAKSAAHAVAADPLPPERGRHPVIVLSGIYLEAGLPLEAAVRSAIADYECCDGETLKAS